MSSGSDDDISVDTKPSRRAPSQSAAQTFAEISDDESDDGRLPQRNMGNNVARTPSPPMDDGDEIRPQRGGSDSGDDDRFGSGYDRDMPAKPKVVEAHERSVVESLPQKDTVDLFHFPPGLEVSTRVATEAELSSHDDFYPISFRPQRRGDARSAVRSALQRGGAIGIGDILESNARLIQWSDNSHTVMVGDEHYYIMNDRLASDYYLFRKGQDIQTVEASVNTVGRLQPYNAGGLSSRLSKLGGNTSPVMKAGKRKLLLTTKRSGEIEEQQAKEEAERKDREKEKLQRKRRATMAAENRSRQRERSPMMNRYISDPEDDDSEAERLAEEQERHKRRRTNDWSFKHQKAGRRKIIGESEDEESDD